jgi:hypothetical protein
MRPIFACVGSRVNVFTESLPSNEYICHSINTIIISVNSDIKGALRRPVQNILVVFNSAAVVLSSLHSKELLQLIEHNKRNNLLLLIGYGAETQ